jgi:hypothetical protein
MAEYIVTIDGDKYKVTSDKPLSDVEAHQAAVNQLNTDRTLAPINVSAKAPTQYSMPAETARAAGQGLTFGFADELEAALRSGAISGKDYEAIRNDLRAKQEQFALENPKTALGSEIAGGFIAPLGALKYAAKAPSILRSAITSAGYGGVQGAGKSTETENLPSDVVAGTALGGIGGAALGTVGAAIAPQLQKGARELQQAGVPLTAGSAFGGQIQSIEQAAESLPIAGELIKGARREQFEAFNKAAFNRALKAIDPKLTVPKELPLREAADFTYQQISNKYNTIYPNTQLSLNNTLNRQLSGLQNKYSTATLGEAGAAQFQAQLNNIKSRFEGGKPITGAQVKALKEDLRLLTDAYKGSAGSEKLLGNAFDDLENSVMMSFRNQNPKYAKDLKSADTAYATYKKVENAAASAKGADGVFTPAQLETAVKQGNKSQYARGKALLQDLSNTGYDVLGNKVPDSGTAGRLGIAGMLTGGAAMLNPKAVVPTAIASGLYTPFGMKYAMPLLTNPRPDIIEQYAPSVRATAPYLTQAVNPLFRGLLDQEGQ